MVRRDIGTDDPRVKVRPGKGRRPRTKKRPDYSHAPVGHVISIDRGRYHIFCNDKQVVAVKARYLGRKGVVVGDRVKLQGDLSGTPGTLARIVDICERSHILYRSADDTETAGQLKPIVANATQLAIVSACADPTPRRGMVDRCLVAAYEAGMRPLLVMTKTDLASPDEFARPYQDLGIDCFFLRVLDGEEDDFQAFRKALENEETVLLGHSGVGKSTVMNALIPEVSRATGHVNDVTGRGRHTSSSLLAHALPEGGWVIDTPGVRGFGLAHVDSDTLLHSFPDIDEIASQCPKGCTHQDDARGCELDLWASDDPSHQARLTSFRRLLDASLPSYER